MKKLKRFGAALLAMVMSAAITFPAMAATSYEYIEEISLNISSSIAVGEADCEVDVTVTTEGCEVDSVTITNEPEDQWDSGDDPEIRVVLVVEDDDIYRFKSITKSKVSLDESDAKVTSASCSSKKATIKIKLPELEYDEGYYDSILEIEDATWDDGSGVGYWTENDNAVRYDVRLYRNDTAVASAASTTDNSYDFSQYFTRKGEYYFKVRAVRSSTIKGEWNESDTIEVDSEEAADIRGTGTSSSTTSSSSSTTTTTTTTTTSSSSSTAGSWMQNEIGWWWCNPDRTYPASNWKLINGCWYYFNASGYCVMNSWVQTNGIWYYCGPNGDMWANRWTPDGYWVNASGAWVQ